MKYTEAMACGTFVLADKPEDLDNFGYIDGKHLVIYNDLKDLKDKIRYYLEHEYEREEIAKNGMKFVRENFNNDVITSMMLSKIKAFITEHK
jgi:spore maturation protein CgeB